MTLVPMTSDLFDALKTEAIDASSRRFAHVYDAFRDYLNDELDATHRF